MMTSTKYLCRVAVISVLILASSSSSCCFAFSPAKLLQSTSMNSNKVQTMEQKAATTLTLDTTVMTPEQDEEESKVGVLLLNLGGPETGDDVEGENKLKRINEKNEDIAQRFV